MLGKGVQPSYAKTLGELNFNKANLNPLTDTPTSRKTYTIGDDVITQQTSGGDPQHLLYDGHGSTKPLAGEKDGSNQVGINEYYSYDAYGVAVDGNPTRASNIATSLLYAGEQFDVDAQMYYLRARYYDPLNGRFNQMDSFAGNNSDPQSLHKYLYCHDNPVNGIDPMGQFVSFTAIGQLVVHSIQACLRRIDVVRHYITYSRAKAILKAVAIAGVIASAFIFTDHTQGIATFKLPFGKIPLLEGIPDVSIGMYKNSQGDPITQIRVEHEDSSLRWRGNINWNHPSESNISFGLNWQIWPKGKGPLTLAFAFRGSFSVVTASPLAVKVGFVVSVKGPSRFAWKTIYSLVQATRNGIEPIFGEPWRYED